MELSTSVLESAILPAIPRRCLQVPAHGLLQCTRGWSQGGQRGTHRRWLLSAIYFALLSAQLLWLACLWAWVSGCFSNYAQFLFGLILRLSGSVLSQSSLWVDAATHSNALKVRLWLFRTKPWKVINFSLICIFKLIFGDQLHPRIQWLLKSLNCNHFLEWQCSTPVRYTLILCRGVPMEKEHRGCDAVEKMADSVGQCGAGLDVLVCHTLDLWYQRSYITSVNLRWLSSGKGG